MHTHVHMAQLAALTTRVHQREEQHTCMHTYIFNTYAYRLQRSPGVCSSVRSNMQLREAPCSRNCWTKRLRTEGMCMYVCVCVGYVCGCVCLCVFRGRGYVCVCVCVCVYAGYVYVYVCGWVSVCRVCMCVYVERVRERKRDCVCVCVF